jgi:ubiquinone biosynthesis accessory factor UbiK
MSRSSLLDEFATRLRAFAAETPAADIERNARAMLANMFSRLDLVTREEFDAQARVLAQTRARLEQLEHRIAALETPADPGA